VLQYICSVVRLPARPVACGRPSGGFCPPAVGRFRHLISLQFPRRALRFGLRGINVIELFHYKSSITLIKSSITHYKRTFGTLRFPRVDYKKIRETLVLCNAHGRNRNRSWAFKCHRRGQHQNFNSGRPTPPSVPSGAGGPASPFKTVNKAQPHVRNCFSYLHEKGSE
jgi:hypothetical protein